MTVCLEIRDGRRRFGRVQALEHVTFGLDEGTWVGLVGPNGAGKTTLMRALCGLETLDQGTITIQGHEAGRALGAGERQQVGVVPQDIALYPLLTPRENLEVFGRLNGVRGAALRDRVAWALAWTGLQARASDRVGTFSGGMKRCLNIACSVLHRPRIVLLDEPTVGVDVAGRERIWEMLRALRDEGTALLQSSHQLHEVQTACDRILVLHHGRILASLCVESMTASSLGATRAVRLTLDRDANGLDLGPRLSVRGRHVDGTLTDVPLELPQILARIGRDGYGVHDVRVEPPRLEDVFAQLTGWRKGA